MLIMGSQVACAVTGATPTPCSYASIIHTRRAGGQCGDQSSRTQTGADKLWLHLTPPRRRALGQPTATWQRTAAVGAIMRLDGSHSVVCFVALRAYTIL